MTELADGTAQFQSWFSLLWPVFVAAILATVFIVKGQHEPGLPPVVSDDSGDELVAELRRQSDRQDREIEDLKRDLRTEREGRAEDNRRWSARFDDLRDEMARLKQDLEITRLQKGIS